MPKAIISTDRGEKPPGARTLLNVSGNLPLTKGMGGEGQKN